MERINCILNQARMHSKVNEHMTTKNMYIFLAHCLEQGHIFTSFCLEQVESLKDSAVHPAVNLREFSPHVCRGNLGLSSNYLTINDHDALIKVVMFHG